jgi:hypothetical protein
MGSLPSTHWPASSFALCAVSSENKTPDDMSSWAFDYDIQAERDERGIPVLSFRAPGAGLQRLDMTGASQLKQLLEQAGDNANAQVIADLIKKAQGH